MLGRVLHPEGALFLIEAAGGDGVIAIEDAAVVREAHQCLMRDLRSSTDVIDIDQARRKIGRWCKPKHIRSQRQIAAGAAGYIGNLLYAVIGAQKDMVKSGQMLQQVAR